MHDRTSQKNVIDKKYILIDVQFDVNIEKDK